MRTTTRSNTNTSFMTSFSSLTQITHLLLLLAVSALFLPNCVSSQSCSFDDNKCILTIKGLSGGDQQVDLSSYKDELQATGDDNRLYYFKPCGTITDSNKFTCIGYKGCQLDGRSYIPIGTATGQVCAVDESKQDIVVYPEVLYNGAYRSVNATYICDKEQEGLSFTFGSNQYQDNKYVYPFMLRGKAACGEASGGGGGGGGGGINGGGVFLIIYFVVIVVYLVGGVLYKAFYKGARGTEVIPNVEFWITVPGLIKDGALFIYRWIASKTCKKGYDSV